ncbi:MAG: hypothetical protein AAFV85_06190 [Cyanobacteria bacterium J06634_6]
MAKMRQRRSLTRKMRMRRLYRHQSPAMRFRRAFSRFFNSSWKPGAACFGLLSGAIAATLPTTWWTLPSLLGFAAKAIATLCLAVMPIAFACLLGSTIWNLAKRRWWRGGISCTLLILFLSSVTTSALQLLLFVRADGI